MQALFEYPMLYNKKISSEKVNALIYNISEPIL